MASGVVSRRLVATVLLGLAEAAAVLGLVAALTAPAAAQNRAFDDRFSFLGERARRGGACGGGGGDRGGGFGGFFENGGDKNRPAAPVAENNTKAPAPARKTDAVPLTS